MQTIKALAELDEPADVDPPVGLKAELRPYQQDGYAWLWRLWSLGLGGILADDMGSGQDGPGVGDDLRGEGTGQHEEGWSAPIRTILG